MLRSTREGKSSEELRCDGEEEGVTNKKFEKMGPLSTERASFYVLARRIESEHDIPLQSVCSRIIDFGRTSSDGFQR